MDTTQPPTETQPQTAPLSPQDKFLQTLQTLLPENETVQGQILLALDNFMIEVAEDLGEVVSQAMGVTLMGIYNSGKMPGPLVNRKLNEVALTLMRHSPKRATNKYKRKK